jgi:hypothetical protein
MTGMTNILPNCTTAVADTGFSLQPDGACNNIPTKSKQMIIPIFGCRTITLMIFFFKL